MGASAREGEREPMRDECKRRRDGIGARAALAGALALLAAAPALANDSSAELTTGGLVLAKSADIEMRSEDLAISAKEIVVRYRFFNHADRDVTTTVAFPMPDIVWDGPDTNIAVPAPDSPNFLDFRTTIDGQPVAAENEQKAFAKGVDITARLAALGVPLAPQSEATGKALDALKPADKDALVKAEIAIPDDYDVGKGWEHHLAPNWTLKSSFFWTQTFPAGRELAVEHRYRPSVGETTGTEVGSPIDRRQKTAKRYATLYCVDKDFIAGARKAQKPGAERLLHRAAVRAAHRLCADDRRQLGRADRRFPPDGGQGRAGFAGQLLRRWGEEDRADDLRGPPRQFHPDPRSQRADPLSAAEERLRGAAVLETA